VTGGDVPDVYIGHAAADPGTPALRLGEGYQLRSGTVLYDGSVIGARLETGHGVVIRERCTIGDDAKIWSHTVIDYGCRLGDRVKVHANCYLAQFTELEDDVFCAPGVSFANDFYPGDPTSADQILGAVVRRGAQIGVNATVLPFVDIGAGSIVGAGAVVTRDVPPGVIVAGNPARVLRPVPVPEAVRDRIGEFASAADRLATRGVRAGPSGGR